MEHRATLEYSEPLVRRAAFAYWRRLAGGAFGLGVALVAASFVALWLGGDRSWRIGVLGTCLVVAVGFLAFAYAARLRDAVDKFERLPTGTGLLVATDDALHLSSALGTLTAPWSAVSRIWRHSDFWIVVLSRRQVATLPLATVSGQTQAFIVERVRSAGGKVVP